MCSFSWARGAVLRKLKCELNVCSSCAATVARTVYVASYRPGPFAPTADLHSGMLRGWRQLCNDLECLAFQLTTGRC